MLLTVPREAPVFIGILFSQVLIDKDTDKNNIVEVFIWS